MGHLARNWWSWDYNSDIVSPSCPTFFLVNYNWISMILTRKKQSRQSQAPEAVKIDCTWREVTSLMWQSTGWIKWKEMGEGSEKHWIGEKVNKVWNQRRLVMVMWAFYRKLGSLSWVWRMFRIWIYRYDKSFVEKSKHTLLLLFKQSWKAKYLFNLPRALLRRGECWRIEVGDRFLKA